jgi:hypothetical protein
MEGWEVKLIDRALELCALNANGATTAEVAQAMKRDEQKTGAVLAYARSTGLLVLSDGGRNKLTRDGQARLDKLASGERPERRKSKRTPSAKSPSARRAPSPQAHAVVVRHNGNGDRASNVRALGAGLLENARGTWDLFRSVLEDQLDESTPMIQAALDAHSKALDLLQAGYRVAT